MDKPCLESSYLTDPNALWLRGNLHTHTTCSDGSDEPQKMVDLYAALGHDFLMISDHDCLGDTKGLDAHGMILVPGTEVCGGTSHMLDVGAKVLIDAQADLQATIDSIRARSGFPILCHPNWEEHFSHYTFEELLDLQNYAGVEICNGVVMDLPGSHLATDKWDRLLGRGRKLWGYANDDAHRPQQVGRCWNVVRVNERSLAAILAALESGSFYASSGVEITAIEVEGAVLKVRTSNADRIAVFGRNGSRITYVDAPEITFDASEVNSPLIRVECFGPRGSMAWTQPFWIRNGQFEKNQQAKAALDALPTSKLQAFRADRPPKISGRVDDPLWAKAQVFGGFVTNHGANKPTVATNVRCIVCEDTLYVAVRCEEPQPDQMRLKTAADGMASIWTDDSIELFLDVQGEGLSCYHLMINADGHTYAIARGLLQPLLPEVRGAADKYAGGWSVEMAIELTQLGIDASEGRRIGFHVCRNRPLQGQCFVWSYTGGSNHNVDRYGSLIL